MNRRSFLVTSMATAGAVVVGSCSSSDEPDGAANRVDPGQDIKTLAPLERPTLRLAGGAFGFPSPFGYTAGIGYYQMSFLYDTLLWKDGSGALMPWLAADVQQSADNLTYTFELRDGLRWHDGTPLTPDDVVFTFEYFAGQELSPVLLARPEGVAGVTATGPRTVEVRLEQPDVTFTEMVAGAVPIVPRHIWSSITDASAAQDLGVLVGSGPYRLESYDGDGMPLLYSANDDYHLGRPFVKRIEMTPVGDELVALMAGELSSGGGLSVGGVRPETLEPFRRDDSFGVIEEKGNFTFPLVFNLDKGGALADADFRRAFTLAVDRADIVERLTGGNGQPGNPGFLAPSNPFFAEVEQYDFDRDAAEALLDEAGYRRTGAGEVREGPGGPLRFELLTSNESFTLALVDILVPALEAVGIELTPRSVELGPQLFAPKITGNFEIMLSLYPGPSGGGPNADPDLLRRVYSSTGGGGLNSAAGYQDPRFEELADRQRVTFDHAERKGLVAEMQAIVARDLPVLPLYYSTVFQIFAKATFDQWYFTPGQYPISINNKQAFITGLKTGQEIRPIK